MKRREKKTKGKWKEIEKPEKGKRKNRQKKRTLRAITLWDKVGLEKLPT
jgi:hypothetical protein